MASFDDIKDKGGMFGTRGADLLKQRSQSRNTMTANETRSMDQLAREMADIDRILAEANNSLDSKNAELARYFARVQVFKKAVENMKDIRIAGADKTFKSGVEAMLSPTSTAANVNAVARSMGSSDSSYSGDMQQHIARDKSSLSKQDERIRRTVEHIEGNEGLFQRQAAHRDRIVTNIGQAQGSMHAASIADQVKRDVERQQIRSDAASGKFGNQVEINEKIGEASQKLITTFEQLSAAIQSGATNVDALSQEFSKTENELSTLKEAAGSAGGGIGGILSGAGAFFKGAGAVTMAGSQVYTNANVTSEMAQTQNRIGLANLSNQRFDNNLNAAHGDMAALRRVMTNQYGEQIGQGISMGAKASIGKLGETAGSGMGILGNALAGAGAGALVGSVVPGVGTAVGGVGGALLGAGRSLLQSSPDIANTAAGGIDVAKQNTQIQTAIERANQIGELRDAENKISDFSKQNVFNYQKSLSLATRGLGGSREGVQGGLLNATNIQNLANSAGLGTEDIPQLVGMGRQGLGGEFRGQADLARSGQLARAGVMQSPEQYFQARSQLSGAGGGAGNLEEILKNAVANGMDNSKNIMQMVEATSALASRSAQMGINTVGGASEMLGKGVDALRGAGVSPNIAVGAAQYAAQDVQNLSSSATLTIPNVIEMQKLRSQFPKATLQQLMSLQHMTVEDATALKGRYAAGDTAGANRLTKQLGVFGQVNNAADVNNILGDKSSKVIQASAGFGLDEEKRKSIERKVASGQKLTDDEESFYNGLKGLSGVSGTAEIGILSNRGARRGGVASGPGTTAGVGEDTIKAGAVADSQVFAKGMSDFQSSLGGYQELGKTMLDVASKLKPEDYAKATQAAAESFQVPAGQFGTAVDKFEGAVDNLINALSGKSSNPNNTGNNLGNNVNHKQSR